MPEHVRSIECCYCGASNFVNLQKVSGQTLKCGECGGGMAVGKMTQVAQPVAPQPKPAPIPMRPAAREDRKLSPQWEEKRARRDDDDDDHKRKRKMPKKKKGFFDRLEDIWDEVEDIFD